MVSDNQSQTGVPGCQDPKSFHISHIRGRRGDLLTSFDSVDRNRESGRCQAIHPDSTNWIQFSEKETNMCMTIPVTVGEIDPVGSWDPRGTVALSEPSFHCDSGHGRRRTTLGK